TGHATPRPPRMAALPPRPLGRRSVSDPLECAGTHAGGEGGPGCRGEEQLGTVGVLGVAYRHGGRPGSRHLDAVATVATAVGRLAPHLGDLDARAAIGAAVTGLAPSDAGQVHVFATSLKSSSEAARGSASVLSVS